MNDTHCTTCGERKPCRYNHGKKFDEVEQSKKVLVRMGARPEEVDHWFTEGEENTEDELID